MGQDTARPKILVCGLYGSKMDNSVTSPGFEIINPTHLYFLYHKKALIKKEIKLMTFRG